MLISYLGQYCTFGASSANAMITNTMQQHFWLPDAPALRSDTSLRAAAPNVAPLTPFPSKCRRHEVVGNPSRSAAEPGDNPLTLARLSLGEAML